MLEPCPKPPTLVLVEENPCQWASRMGEDMHEHGSFVLTGRRKACEDFSTSTFENIHRLCRQKPAKRASLIFFAPPLPAPASRFPGIARTLEARPVILRPMLDSNGDEAPFGSILPSAFISSSNTCLHPLLALRFPSKLEHSPTPAPRSPLSLQAQAPTPTSGPLSL